MSKIAISDISSGYASTSAINEAFNAIENELNNKVLYRNNPSGEPNQMENDLDLNGNDILNAGSIYVNGQDILAAMQEIYNNYVNLTQNVTVSTEAPSGGQDGDIWFRVSA
jgi:hypothetical protein